MRERQRRATVTGDVEDLARVYADKLRTSGPCVECSPTADMHRNEDMRRWERRFAKGEKWPQRPGQARIVTVYTDGTRGSSLHTLMFHRITRSKPRLRRVGVSHYEVALHDVDRATCPHCWGTGNPILGALTILARAGNETAVAVLGPVPPLRNNLLANVDRLLGLAAEAARRLEG